MEKSIESIWKEGFLKSDVLVAPKVNDIYNKKSEHIVDKFTRMFKTNLVVIVLCSFFVVGMSYAHPWPLRASGTEDLPRPDPGPDPRVGGPDRGW